MNEAASAVAQLASREEAERQRAAAQLYRAGLALADSAIEAWRADAEFAGLLRGLPTVGVAVHAERFAAIRAAFGSPPLAEVPPDQDALEFELDFAASGGTVLLDILTTRDPAGGGAIARFLAKSGEGIQQVEFPVADVDRATELLRSRFALQPIYPATRPGANGARVNFFLAATVEGKKVLIELVEYERPHSQPQH